VSALYAELGRLEPGKWYRHKPAGNLLNGGPHFPDIEATSLTLEELVATVQRFPPG